MGIFAGGAAVLAACGPSVTAGAPTGAPAGTSAPAAGGTVNFLWTDSSNARQPLIADFSAAKGIKVTRPRLITTLCSTRSTLRFRAVAASMSLRWTRFGRLQFAAAGYVEDVTDRVTDAIKKDIPESALGP